MGISEEKNQKMGRWHPKIHWYPHIENLKM
jgi:hypothetical protein